MFYRKENKMLYYTGHHLRERFSRKIAVFYIALFFMYFSVLIVAAERGEVPKGRIFDCGANCLYIVNRIQGKTVSYEKCIELLPLSPQGNSMLELKAALESLSYQVYAMSVSAEELKNIKVPTIVLDGFGKQGRRIGHYVVMQPLPNNYAKIYDYPREVKNISLVDLFESKSTEGLQNIPVLLCCDKAQSLNHAFDHRPKESESPSAEASPDIPARRNKSRIEIDSADTRYSLKADFSELPEGSEFSHVFVIKNNSSETLFVDKVMASCQCAGIKIDKKEIPPEEEAAVTMDISLDRKYGNVLINGTVIFSSGSKIPPLVLSVKGTSLERWTCYPNKIDFGEIEPGKSEVTKSVILERKIGGTSSSITAIKASSKYLKSRMETINADKAILHLTFVNNNVERPFRGEVEIFLDQEESPAAHIDISASVKTLFYVSPCKLFFSHESNVDNSKRVIIASRDKQPFILNSIEVEKYELTDFDLNHSFNNEKNEMIFDAMPLIVDAEGEGYFSFSIEKEGLDHVIKVPFVIIP